jgi:hypothetical protein
MKNKTVSGVVYFEQEGRQNLSHVLNTVKSAFRKREDVRTYKVVIFTAAGEGPALAYNKLKQYSPKIIAVTFPAGFSIRRSDNEGKEITTPIYLSDELTKFFAGVGIPVLRSRLPFDGLGGAESIAQQMKLIRDVLSLFGGGFSLCVQAVLQACDMGTVDIGEKVVVITGDCAAIITASTTARFLLPDGGLSINEILCKPRNLSLTRKPIKQPKQISGQLFPAEKEIKLLPPI